VQPFHLESITAGADCAVLRITGEVDVYTAPQLRRYGRLRRAKYG
jgi:hypothetical protein